MKVRFNDIEEFNIFIRKCKGIYINDIQIEEESGETILGKTYAKYDIQIDCGFEEEEW